MPMQAIYPEHMRAQFPTGTFNKIATACRDGETRAAFVRRAVSMLVRHQRKLAEIAERRHHETPEREPPT